MSRVYIAGPITCGGALGASDVKDNTAKFAEVADRLRSYGHTAINPAAMFPPCEDPTWADWMRQGITAMLTCDTICLMPGWEGSKGASIEASLAETLGFDIWTAECHYGTGRTG